MNLALFLFAAAIALSAMATSAFLWSRFATEAPGPWEKSASVVVLFFVITTLINWILSWFRLLDRAPLLIVALGAGTAGGVYLLRSGLLRALAQPLRIRVTTALSALPLLLWIAFALWRGALLPVLSHDALAYHLPKAVMLARAHQFEFFSASDPRISTSPANYEMLLADVILLTGSDDLTEWISTLAYVAFLLLAGALFERWWGKGLHTIIGALLVAAVPVLVLHIGAHKNDVLANVFYLAALLWGGRWMATRDTAPLVMMLASLGTTAGTKVLAAMPIVAISAIAFWLVLRGKLTIPRKQLALSIFAVALAVPLLGGWAYIENLRHTGEMATPSSDSSGVGYGDWSNILEVPGFLLLRPFDLDNFSVHVPWRDQRWFWPRYEFYFSDFGILPTLLALLLPLTIPRYKARWADARMHRERLMASAAALTSFVLMLPIRIRPFGFFAGFPRYFVFIIVFVIAWTAVPLVKHLEEMSKAIVVRVVAAASVLVLALVTISLTINDAFQPLSYVEYVLENPWTRTPHFATYRAATVADLIAGPSDKLAVQAGFDSWIYPLYGKDFQRRVVFISANDPLPPDARFIVVDRAWNTIWGHPQFKNMGEYQKYLGKGNPSVEDQALLRRLFQEKETYVPVYYLRSRCQGLFMRRDSAPAAAAGPPKGS